MLQREKMTKQYIVISYGRNVEVFFTQEEAFTHIEEFLHMQEGTVNEIEFFVAEQKEINITEAKLIVTLKEDTKEETILEKDLADLKSTINEKKKPNAQLRNTVVLYTPEAGC